MRKLGLSALLVAFMVSAVLSVTAAPISSVSNNSGFTTVVKHGKKHKKHHKKHKKHGKKTTATALS